MIPAADVFLAYLSAPLGEHAYEFDDFSNRWARLLHTPFEFCLLNPVSMHRGIIVPYQIMQGISSDAVCELGEGPTSARLDLERFAKHNAPYRNNEKDMSEVKYQFAISSSEEEVRRRPDDVIEKMKNLRKTRWNKMEDHHHAMFLCSLSCITG